jgi:P-type E1-E2 ATPase
MIKIHIPGERELIFEHLVLDFNGTLACDGRLIPGVRECLTSLADRLQIHILTADTQGSAQHRVEHLPCRLSILPGENQDQRKLEYVEDLGSECTVCIGNGRNDRLMIRRAALGIAVVLEEGAAVDTLRAADIVCKDIVSALKLLLHPLRLVATLRL